MKYLAALLLLATSSVHAQMAVDITGAVYSTDLSLSWTELRSLPGQPLQQIPKSMAKSTSQSTPVINTITSPDNPKRFATGNANTFFVSAGTSAFPTFDGPVSTNSGLANATAKSTLTFKPRSNGLTPLSLAFDGSGEAAFSHGFVSLFDTTLNKSLSFYSWDRSTMAGNIPWDTNFDAFVNVAANLSSSHLYTLAMSVSTDANTDSQAMSIRMGGLTMASAAPEPEMWAMMLLGLGGVGFAARRRRRASL